MMLRGGFASNAKASLTYAVYASAVSTAHNNLGSDRNVGARVRVFLPGPRVEIGASWQKLLPDESSNAFGLHFAWLSTSLPLNVPSEYARSTPGRGYSLDGAY